MINEFDNNISDYSFSGILLLTDSFNTSREKVMFNGNYGNHNWNDDSYSKNDVGCDIYNRKHSDTENERSFESTLISSSDISSCEISKENEFEKRLNNSKSTRTSSAHVTRVRSCIQDRSDERGRERRTLEDIQMSNEILYSQYFSTNSSDKCTRRNSEISNEEEKEAKKKVEKKSVEKSDDRNWVRQHESHGVCAWDVIGDKSVKEKETDRKKSQKNEREKEKISPSDTKKKAAEGKEMNSSSYFDFTMNSKAQPIKYPDSYFGYRKAVECSPNSAAKSRSYDGDRVTQSALPRSRRGSKVTGEMNGDRERERDGEWGGEKGREGEGERRDSRGNGVYNIEMNGEEDSGRVKIKRKIKSGKKVAHWKKNNVAVEDRNEEEKRKEDKEEDQMIRRYTHQLEVGDKGALKDDGKEKRESGEGKGESEGDGEGEGEGEGGMNKEGCLNAIESNSAAPIQVSMLRLTAYHTTPYHITPHHTTPYHTIPHHTIPYHAIPYHAMPCHAIPHHTIQCASQTEL